MDVLSWVLGAAVLIAVVIALLVSRVASGCVLQIALLCAVFFLIGTGWVGGVLEFVLRLVSGRL